MQGVFFAAVKGQVLFLASRPDRGLRAVFPLAGAMECRTDNPCDRISTVPGSPASHRTAPAGFAALRGGIGRRDRGGIFGTAGAQTGVRVPDSDGGEVTPATRSRTGTTSRSAGSLNEGRGRDPGDTGASGRSTNRRWSEHRSTKAGVETPATRPRAGAFWRPVLGAQRRPGSRPRRHGRFSLTAPCGSSLNEGRGRDPGDTLRTYRDTRSRWIRSTKAGVETPATHELPPQVFAAVL